MISRRVNLTASILASLTLLLLLTWLLLSLISIKTAQQDLYAQKNDFARMQLASLLALLPEDLAESASSAGTRRYLAVLQQEPAFAGLLLVDRSDKVRLRRGGTGEPDLRLRETLARGGESSAYAGNGRYLHRYAAVVRGGEVVAAARLTLSLDHELQRLKRSQQLYLAYFFLDFLLLLGFGSFLLSRFIVTPLQRLVSATERIAAGDYSQRVHTGGGREIGELADSFNAMLDTLKAKREEVELHLQSLQETNRQLQDAREEAIRSAKLASVGVLSAGMAHEIGTPLASILGYAEILRGELGADPEKADYVRRIGEACGRIDRIVRGLLDLSRPTPPECEEVDIPRLIGSTLELLAAQGIFRRIETTVSCAAGLPRLYIDPHQLQQVLINLLINARDAMPTGGRITITATQGEFSAGADHPLLSVARGRRKDDFGGVFHAAFDDRMQQIPCIRLEVADTGEGIPAEQLDRIFDPFFTTKEPGQGTGLGLAISARIIDAFNGRTTVASEVGKGSRFVIWLPLSKSGEQGVRNR